MANSQFQDHHEQTFVNDLDLWMAEMSQMDVDFDRVYPLVATSEDNLQQQNATFSQQQTMLLQSPPLPASYNPMHSSLPALGTVNPARDVPNPRASVQWIHAQEDATDTDPRGQLQVAPSLASTRTSVSTSKAKLDLRTMLLKYPEVYYVVKDAIDVTIGYIYDNTDNPERRAGESVWVGTKDSNVLVVPHFSVVVAEHKIWASNHHRPMRRQSEDIISNNPEIIEHIGKGAIYEKRKVGCTSAMATIGYRSMLDPSEVVADRLCYSLFMYIAVDDAEGGSATDEMMRCPTLDEKIARARDWLQDEKFLHSGDKDAQGHLIRDFGHEALANIVHKTFYQGMGRHGPKHSTARGLQCYYSAHRSGEPVPFANRVPFLAIALAGTVSRFILDGFISTNHNKMKPYVYEQFFDGILQALNGLSGENSLRCQRKWKTHLESFPTRT
ncbi:hypothetical protein EW146_g8687 [Bondarzewia mesenterica]|uniref:DUF6532 domain-containing protein n=1 Tax=Bondarzewia mesenterica TaxID=1095465 RepID=A0A4S4LHW2_9AGAM|nr:hypothetical protein EW146_g8687 [Bondarzewia mesenterica]